MKPTKTRLLKVLSPGEFVYLYHNGKLGRTEVVNIDDYGVDTKCGYLDYETHGTKWWLTKSVALQNKPI